MNRIRECLRISSALVGSVVTGVVSGAGYLASKGFDCIRIDVPPIEPDVDVSIDASEVNISDAFINSIRDRDVILPNGQTLFSLLGFNSVNTNQTLAQALADIKVNTDVTIPDVTPEISAADCIPPVVWATGIAVGVALTGLLVYYGTHCYEAKRRQRIRRADDVERGLDERADSEQDLMVPELDRHRPELNGSQSEFELVRL